MATTIRAELAEKSKYYISKHRYYELKHFCLQYNEWKQKLAKLDTGLYPSCKNGEIHKNDASDPTSRLALLRTDLQFNIAMVEEAAKETDEYLSDYILKAVTQDLSFAYLVSHYDIGCGKDMYYDRYRKFFWLLHRSRN